VKIIWNRNRWLREHGAGYIVVGWGLAFPTTEKKLQRDLERWNSIKIPWEESQ
jgi:hypothetical protein